MKLNNKGFAISTILYGTMILFLMLILSMLGILATYKDRMETLIENNNGARDIVNSIVNTPESSTCIIYYYSWPNAFGQSTELATQEITEGEKFNLMNIDGYNMSLDVDDTSCYSPGTIVNLECSSIVYVDNGIAKKCGDNFSS